MMRLDLFGSAQALSCALRASVRLDAILVLPPHLDFTKRSHRFLADFLMEVPMNTCVAAETCERNRWVRFGKRTHR